MPRWPKQTEQERFWSHVNKQVDSCWDWTAGMSSNGYGVFNGHILPHRYAYVLFNGPIPEGLQIDHLCRNRACVNPDHLEAVTASENIRRGVGPELTRQRILGRTHCPHGHPYDEYNTRIYEGRRYCNECNRLRGPATYQRRLANGYFEKRKAMIAGHSS